MSVRVFFSCDDPPQRLTSADLGSISKQPTPSMSIYIHPFQGAIFGSKNPLLLLLLCFWFRPSGRGGDSVNWQSFVNHFFIPSCLLKGRNFFSTPCDRSSVNIKPSHHQIAFLSSVFMLGLFGEIEEGIRREKRGKKLGLVVVAHLLVRFQPNHHLICKLIRTT